MAADGERHERVAQALNQVISMQVRKAPGAEHWRRRRRIVAHQEQAPAAGCALLHPLPPPAACSSARPNPDVLFPPCRAHAPPGLRSPPSPRPVRCAVRPARYRVELPAQFSAHPACLTMVTPMARAESAGGDGLLGAHDEDGTQLATRLTRTVTRVKLLVRRRAGAACAPLRWPQQRTHACLAARAGSCWQLRR